MTHHPLTYFAAIWVMLCMQGCAIFSQWFTYCPTNYTDGRYEVMRYTNYPVPATHKSPRGIAVGPGVDGEEVDRLTGEVEACMGVRVHECAIHAVMLAPDWFVSPDPSHTQVFPCRDTPPENLCHGVNQWPATIIITPDLHAYKWELVRLLTRTTPTSCF